MFAVSDRHSFPDGEEETLQWWEENDTFKESVRLSEGRPRWSFYDGPPFATGLPHYGHILAGTIKVRVIGSVQIDARDSLAFSTPLLCFSCPLPSFCGSTKMTILALFRFP